jgi:hypothetical protein
MILIYTKISIINYENNLAAAAATGAAALTGA